MFFQMRRTIGVCENTRVFREVTALGKELKELGDLTLGATTKAKVALYFDWDNWWAIEYSAGPSCKLKYKDEILNYYQALYKQNIPVENLEVTMRSNENGAFLFLLNHGGKSCQVLLEEGGYDLLTKENYEPGRILIIEKKDVTILKKR